MMAWTSGAWCAPSTGTSLSSIRVSLSSRRRASGGRALRGFGRFREILLAQLTLEDLAGRRARQFEVGQADRRRDLEARKPALEARADVVRHRFVKVLRAHLQDGRD